MAQGFYPESFYESTLSLSVGATDTTIYVTTPPTMSQGYLVIESDNSARREIISYTGKTATSITGVTRGLAFYGTDDSAGTGVSHPAGASIACKDVHYYDTYQLDFIAGISATGFNKFLLGDLGTCSATNRVWDVALSSYTPFWGLSANGKMVVSEDGINSYVISAGGGSLGAGDGIYLLAGNITVNPLSTGGLSISAGKLKVNYSGNSLKSTSAGELYFDKTIANNWTGLNDFTDISIDSVQISAKASEINQLVSGTSAYSNLTAYNLNQIYGGVWRETYGELYNLQAISSKGCVGFVNVGFSPKFVEFRGSRTDNLLFNHPLDTALGVSATTSFISSNGTINGSWVKDATQTISAQQTYVYARSTSAYGTAISAAQYFTVTDFCTSGFSWKCSGSYQVGAGGNGDLVRFYYIAKG